MHPMYLFNYTYNNYNQLIISLVQCFNQQDSIWVNYSLALAKKDNNGNELKFFSGYWNNQTLNWDTILRSSNSYNQAFLTQDIMMPSTIEDINYPRGYNIDFNSYNMVNESDEFDIPSIPGVYMKIANRKYFYSNLNPNSVLESEENGLKVFPNPAFDIVHIEIDDSFISGQIYLYDMLGQLVLKNELNSKIVIDVGALNSGLYIYKIVLDKDIFSGKLQKY